VGFSHVESDDPQPATDSPSGRDAGTGPR
jgi:hypothetical protein